MLNYPARVRKYLIQHQPFVWWHGDRANGVCRLGKFELDPEMDWIHHVEPGRFDVRPANPGEKSSVPVSALKALRHLPYGVELELYLGDLPREDRERIKKALPHAKEITDD